MHRCSPGHSSSKPLPEGEQLPSTLPGRLFENALFIVEFSRVFAPGLPTDVCKNITLPKLEVTSGCCGWKAACGQVETNGRRYATVAAEEPWRGGSHCAPFLPPRQAILGCVKGPTKLNEVLASMLIGLMEVDSGVYSTEAQSPFGIGLNDLPVNTETASEV